MCWSWMGPLVVCATLTLTDSECHCANETACTVFPSTPCSQVGDAERCQEGWFGSYCQKQNIALRRPCNQSSRYSEDFGAAEDGVDGNAATVLRTCTHTKNETNPSWIVNLNTSVSEMIQHIRLYLRPEFLKTYIGMEIHVGSQMCYNWSPTDHPPLIANVTCRQPLTGTTVTIRIPGQQTYLCLCEVQIFVCSNGWFSEDCDKQCRCLNSNDACDKITGRCSSGCFPGYNGTDCQTACPDGVYGVNCSSRCGKCLDGVICNKTTGTCPGGCAAGWINVTCQQAHWQNSENNSSDSEVPTKDGCRWGVPVAVILAVLLIFTEIGGTIYIRQLLKQLDGLKTKMKEERYVTLDEMTKVPATESTYEHIGNTTPYYNTVNRVQDETG